MSISSQRRVRVGWSQSRGTFVSQVRSATGPTKVQIPCPIPDIGAGGRLSAVWPVTLRQRQCGSFHEFQKIR